MNEFIKYAPKELFIDPAEIFVKYLREDLKSNNLLSNSNIIGLEQFYVSSKPDEFIKNAKIFYDVKELPIVI